MPCLWDLKSTVHCTLYPLNMEYAVHCIHSIWSALYIISTLYGVHCTLYPLNMECIVHCIHSIWSTLYMYIVSTQYGVHCIHSIWSTLYPLNMEYIVSTQYGVHCIHSIWSTLYPLNMEYIISTQYGVHCIHSIWSIEPMVFRDRGKRTEFAEWVFWNGIGSLTGPRRKGVAHTIIWLTCVRVCCVCVHVFWTMAESTVPAAKKAEKFFAIREVPRYLL